MPASVRCVKQVRAQVLLSQIVCMYLYLNMHGMGYESPKIIVPVTVLPLLLLVLELLHHKSGVVQAKLKSLFLPPNTYFHVIYNILAV